MHIPHPDEIKRYLVNLDGCLGYPGFRIYFNLKYENDALLLGNYIEETTATEGGGNRMLFLYVSNNDIESSLGKKCRKGGIFRKKRGGFEFIFALTPSMIGVEEYEIKLKKTIFAGANHECGRT